MKPLCCNSGSAESSKPNQGDDDSGHSSDSSFENYYLWCEEERDFMNFVENFLVSELAAGRLSCRDYPLSLINDLKDRMKDNSKWENIRGDTDYVMRILAEADKKIKNKGAACERRSTKRKAGDHNCQKRLRKRIMASPSSLSTAGGARTSSHWFQPIQGGGDIGETSIGESPAKAEPPQGGGDGTGGGESRVIRRELNKSDMDDHQQRLSMPCNQALEGRSFLTEEELEKLNQRLYVPIKVVDPDNRTYDANLRKTKAGPKTYSYAIGKPWNDVKKKNGFTAGMLIDIWAFRGEGKELCLRLQRVREESSKL